MPDHLLPRRAREGRQAQAALAADPFGPGECLRRMASVILGVAAIVPVMCVVHMVVMHRRV